MAQSSHPDTAEFFSVLAKHIRKLREERGLSVHQMVVEHGYFEQQYRKIEKGSSGITIDSLLRLCSAFGISMKSLMTGCECGEFPKLDKATVETKAPGKVSSRVAAKRTSSRPTSA